MKYFVRALFFPFDCAVWLMAALGQVISDGMEFWIKRWRI